MNRIASIPFALGVAQSTLTAARAAGFGSMPDYSVDPVGPLLAAAAAGFTASPVEDVPTDTDPTTTGQRMRGDFVWKASD